MQGTITTHPSPETRSIETISDGLDDTGRQAIIAEEQTHAAEILSTFTGRGIIPRDYRLENGEICSEYGISLREVLDQGVADVKSKVENGVLGAEKELRRRQIERANLDKITAMPVGFALIEWSLTDPAWSQEEQRQHGYFGATMARITAKIGETSFEQANIILHSSDFGIINKCRAALEPGEPGIYDAEEMLDKPQVVGLGIGSIVELSTQIETEYVHAKINGSSASLARTALGRILILRKVARELKKTNSWDYVTGQEDVFDALVRSFSLASRLQTKDWQTAASLARGGAWNKLIERYQGRDTLINTPADAHELLNSAKRAATADFVFVACGGSIDMKSLFENPSSSLERTVTVAALIEKIAGVGCCSSCGKSGSLYGCGVFCRTCNEIWCAEYLSTGQQLEPKQIALKKFTPRKIKP